MQDETIGGAVAGGIATLAMSSAMMAAQGAGLMGKQPPERITEAALNTLGVDRTEETQDALAVGMHFAAGMTFGAVYGTINKAVRLPIPGAAKGMLYGLGVWAVNYQGWVPALNIMPPPKNDRPGRPEAMIVAHLLYGAVLGALIDGDRTPNQTR